MLVEVVVEVKVLLTLEEQVAVVVAVMEQSKVLQRKMV
jgi:hypothetical protein